MCFLYRSFATHETGKVSITLKLVLSSGKLFQSQLSISAAVLLTPQGNNFHGMLAKKPAFSFHVHCRSTHTKRINFMASFSQSYLSIFAADLLSQKNPNNFMASFSKSQLSISISTADLLTPQDNCFHGKLARKPVFTLHSHSKYTGTAQHLLSRQACPKASFLHQLPPKIN